MVKWDLQSRNCVRLRAKGLRLWVTDYRNIDPRLANALATRYRGTYRSVAPNALIKINDLDCSLEEPRIKAMQASA